MRTLNRKAWSAIHDDPVAKLKAQAAEAHSKSPHAKAMQRHTEERRALGQDHRKEGLELESKHRLARNAENEISRPKPAMAEENREKESKALFAKQDRERSALRQHHERELGG
jgi:hypothetical protein